MSPTEPLYPGTVADGGGASSVWSNPSNAKVSDAVYATNSIVSATPSNYLQSTNYTFNIPSFGVIDGIFVEFQRKGGISNVTTSEVSIMKAGSRAGTLKPGTDTWPTSEAWTGYGSATDLWGTTWLPSDINATGFGMALSATTTHGSDTASVDAIRITVYWHVAPTYVPKRYLYKVFSNTSGQYIGILPNVTTPFTFSQDINTAGTNLQITCGVSPDTSSLPSDDLTDESGNILTDESGNALTTEGTPPIVSIGTGQTAIIQNGNRLEIWESGYFNPNGKIVFKGEIERWEASFGGAGDGSGGAATSDTGADSITITAYSDGQDLDNYMIRANPYTYTTDQSQLSNNSSDTLIYNAGKPFNWNFDGQSWKVGTGVTNLGAINLLLNGTANVTLTVYTDSTATTILGSLTQEVSVGSPTVVQFAFPVPVVVVPGTTCFFGASVDSGDSILIYYQNTNVYANGEMYNSDFTGTSGGSWIAQSSQDLYFETFSGVGSTTGVFTSVDPTNGMLIPVMQDYIARGGIIGYTSSSIEATGLSLTYQFNTNTTYEGVQDILTLAPDGFYYYVDIGTNILYFKQANNVADIVLTKDRHFDQITIIATIENIYNQTFVSGGIPTGSTNNIYVTASDPTSIALYGPRLDRLSDTGILDNATGLVVAQSDVAENKDEQYQTTVTVLDQTMDTTLLKVGLVIGFNGFGSFADSLLAQIVRVDFTPEEVTLTLGTIPRRVIPQFEKITRGLIAMQTVANPVTPS